MPRTLQVRGILYCSANFQSERFCFTILAMYREKRISLVMPCLNEEQGLPQVARDLPAIVDQVIVVDNNSTDNTAAVARSFGWTVVPETRRGYGRAYKTGLAAATGD